MGGRWIQVVFAVAGAVVPLVGVLSGSWSLREVVVLYWVENLVIGVLQVIKMVTAWPENSHPLEHLAKLFIVPFFIFHYGMFCFVHGIFVFALTGGAFGGGGGGGGASSSPGEMFAQLLEFPRPFWLALGLITAGRVQEMVSNYFLNGRWREPSLQELMGEPYKHIIVVHIGILGGAFLSVMLGNPIGVLLIIVIGKLLIDLKEIRSKAAPTETNPKPDSP